MKTLLLVRDVLERKKEKLACVRAVAKEFGCNLDSPNAFFSVVHKGFKIAIDLTTQEGRCEEQKLCRACMEADIIITPAIGGAFESRLARGEINEGSCLQSLLGKDYNVIIIPIPQLRKPLLDINENLSKVYGDYMLNVIDYIIDTCNHKNINSKSKSDE